MDRDAASSADVVVHWTVRSEDAGDRRRCPRRQCADDDLRRPASAGTPSVPAGPALPVSAAPGVGDDELAERIAAGDASALQIAYDRYASSVYGLALAIVRNEAAAETVLSETFVHLWAQPAPPAVRDMRLAARLLEIGRTLAVEAARISRAESAESEVNQARTMIAAGLTDDQRRALELAYFAGLSEREIADRLGRSVAEVRRLLRLGFARLRDGPGDTDADRGSTD